MRKNIKPKVGAFGTIFRGRRHQGRHRCTPTPADQARLGLTDLASRGPEMARVDHLCTDPAAQDL